MPSGGPLVCLVVAVGLMFCCYAENRSRETLAPNPWLLWFGVILIVAPIAYRVTALSVSSKERMALVALGGLAIYATRLMRDPYGYSFVDDFPHALSLEHILSSHHLFAPNALLPVIAHYPGLEASASSLSWLTGMSTFGTGLLYVGIARVTLMIALYVLFTGVSRSARVGALSALLFAANSNFFYFETQFAYESLSLPLLAVALAAMAERQRAATPAPLSSWGIVAAATICAIIPTHHLTSYALVVILWMMCLRRLRLPRPFRSITLITGPPVWPFALLATLLAAAWLVVVASQTVGYISPDIITAFSSAFRTLTGSDTARGLFSGSTITGPGVNNLLTEEATSFLEPVLLLVAGAVGAWRMWRTRHLESVVVVLTVMAVLYFVLTAFRVVPSAWEVGNRGSEFMFIGMAFMVGASTLWRPRLWSRPSFRILVGAACGISVVGAAVAGMEADARLARPTLFTASDGVKVYSESEAVARWFRTQPPGRVLGDDAEALAINVYGNHTTLGGVDDDADAILSRTEPYPGEYRQIKRDGFRYVVVDLRHRSQDSLEGLYLNLIPPAAPLDRTFKPSVARIWEQHAARIYDSGDVMVFDLDRRP